MIQPDVKWYREQCARLLSIVRQDDGFITRDYVAEKLCRILNEVGVGIHPSLEPDVKRILEK